jgi:hypothetical protein
VSHFRFNLDDASDAGGRCDGCTEAVTIAWSSAALYTVNDSTPVIFTGPGLGSDVVNISGHYIYGIFPTSGPATGPVQVHIQGFGIDPAASARLTRVGAPDIVGYSTSVDPDGQRLTTTFDLTGQPGGLWNLVVRHPDGATSSWPYAFTIIAGAQVSSIQPNFGYDTGAVPVEIHGVGFTPGMSVRLVRGAASIQASTPSIDPSAQSLTTSFNLLDRPAGLWDVVVQNPGTSPASLLSAFQIRLGPHITTVTPSYAANDGVKPIRIDGRGFQSGATARLHRSGSTDITGQSVVVAPDGHSLTANFDLSGVAVGAWDVKVTNPDAVEATQVAGFVVEGFGINAVVPNYGANQGVMSIRIDGSGFQSGATARIHRAGSTDITGQSVVVSPDGHSLTADFDLTAATIGAWDVTVRNPNAVEASKVGGFQVQGLGITDVVPNSGQNFGVSLLTINGSAFISGVSVWIVPPSEPPIPGQSVTVSPAGDRITAQFNLTSHVPAVCDVRVQNPNGSTVTKPNAFQITQSNTVASGLDLSWGACNSPVPGTGDLALDCGNPDAVATLFANFQVPMTYTGFFALDASLDVQTAGTTLPAFWHFENGGCNAGGLAVFDEKPAAVCPDASNGTPWGNGSPSDALITAYGAGFGGANRARLLITVARASSNPITLDGGRNYYAFHLALATSGAGGCPGCATPAGIIWNSAVLYSLDHASVELVGAGLRSNFVTVNGGGVPTPTELILLQGRWDGDRVEIRWQFRDGESFGSVAVQRARNERGPWTPIDAAARIEDDAMVVSDRGANVDATYYYRLLAVATDGTTHVFGPIVVTPDGGPGTVGGATFTLIAPNPTPGALRIGFALARAGKARLSVMDVQGREVATVAEGEYPAGRFETNWNGRVGGQDAPMGLYFVRLWAGGVTMTRRVALAR